MIEEIVSSEEDSELKMKMLEEVLGMASSSPKHEQVEEEIHQ
jgi:hypothetical protein